jgi:DNA-binding NarL/FixJ family response regulator
MQPAESMQPADSRELDDEGAGGDRAQAIERGRAAYARRAWEEAYQSLAGAEAAAPLEPEDLWRLAQSAYLTGREDGFLGLLERGYQRSLEPSPIAAARCAFWLGFRLASRGEAARASGWLSRAGRLIEPLPAECVEHGYLLLPSAHRQLMSGDHAAAYATAGRAVAFGQRLRDGDLLALGLHIQAVARLAGGGIDEGLTLLDEAMVAVTSDELSPHVAGLIYCSAISACRRVYAVGRAHEWTTALASWCARQPDLVAYSGECLVYRAEILRMHGEWRASIDEATRACDRLDAGTAAQATALAFYQIGETHRLLGAFAAAEEAYRSASRLGRQPEPGLSLLRLAQGDVAAAAATIKRAVAETGDPLQRARLLPAAIEILLAAGDSPGARGAYDGLAHTAALCGTGLLDTMAAHAHGAILLAEGDPAAALVELRRAFDGWQEVAAPYDAARVRELIGSACRALGDEDGAALEFEAARAAFDELGAAPDAARVAAATSPAARARTHGLTPRELDVLALVATGRTNRAIADVLCISEKTVARHISNMFGKLGLTSRAAATAYAYEHDLI